MRKLLAWAGKNLDGSIALAVALAIALLGVTNVVGHDLVESATLLVLALLAEVILRERWQRNRVEGEVRDGLERTSRTLATLPERLDGLDGIAEVMTQSRAALAKLSMVHVLDGAEVGAALSDARRYTDRWHFKGGTGTYLRAVTLPQCIKNARARKGRLTFRIEIVDPTDEVVCERYAEFRSALSPDGTDGTGEQWTPDRTRKEAFATILAAYWHKQRSGLLDIDVRLSPVMTTFRWDLSARFMVITQEDPRAPALSVEEGTFFYDRWSTELMSSLEQARRVPLEKARQTPLSDRPTVEETRRLFESAGIPLPRSFNDQDVANIVQKAIEPRNPYE